MSEERALYVRDREAYVGTRCTSGGWDRTAQSGGAVLALLGHVIEDVPAPVPMNLSRLTVDLVRPVPVGERLWIDTQVVREGRLIQVVDLVVRSTGSEHVRARALRIRQADPLAGDAPRWSSADDRDLAELPAPEELQSVGDRPENADFTRFGVEFRRPPERTGAGHCLWVRLRVPVVAGEPIRDSSRATLPMDCVNLLGVPRMPPGVTAINPDVSGHLLRPPTGEWTALVGGTRFAAGVGQGFSVATMVDREGAFGVTSTSQVVQAPR